MDTYSTTDGPIPLMKAASAVVVEPTPPPVVPPAPIIPVAATPQAPKGSWGGLISIILIVFVFIVAAFYSWGERLETQTSLHPDTETNE